MINSLASYASSEDEGADDVAHHIKLPTPLSQSVVDEAELEPEVLRKRQWEMDEAKRNSKSLPSQKKAKVQIVLPELPLNDTTDSEEDDAKPTAGFEEKSIGPKPRPLASSLLSMLPKPTVVSKDKRKEQTTHFFTAKKVAASQNVYGFSARSAKHAQNPVNVAIAPKNSETSAKMSLLAADYGSSSNDEEEDDQKGNGPKNFFSLTSQSEEIGESAEQEKYDDYSYSGETELFEATKVAAAHHPSQIYNLAEEENRPNVAGPSSSSSNYIDDEKARKMIYENEIMKMSDGVNYVLPDDLDIVDVSVDSHLGDVRENILKNLTSASSKPPDAMLVAAQMAGREAGSKGRKGKQKVDPTAKRKHQITYLAHLAKEREEALQNEWAKGRQTRRESRMKYGF